MRRGDVLHRPLRVGVVVQRELHLDVLVRRRVVVEVLRADEGAIARRRAPAERARGGQAEAMRSVIRAGLAATLGVRSDQVKILGITDARRLDTLSGSGATVGARALQASGVLVTFEVPRLNL